MTFICAQILHHYWQIGLGHAAIVGTVFIRERERLPERVLNLALLVALRPLALVACLLVLLFVPYIFDCHLW